MAGRCCSALAAVSPRQRTGQAETSRVSGRRALEIYSNPPKKKDAENGKIQSYNANIVES